MGDPLSVAASITALLQLASSVTTSLRDMKAASKDSKKLLLEISVTRGILATLSDTVHDVKDSDTWAVTIKTLSEPSSPLMNLQIILQRLDEKLKTVAVATGLNKLTHSLLWPFTSKETESAIRIVERQKASLTLALDNDHILLSQQIKRDTAAIHSGIQEIQKGVDDIFEGLTLVEKEQQDSLISETMLWLSPLRFQAKQNDVLRKRSGDSGSWLLQTPEFRAWMAGEQTRLFCRGIAGAGKTVLASIVVDHLLTYRDEGVAVTFIYCDYAEKGLQRIENLLGSIITQLVQQRKPLISNVVDLYKQKGRRDCGPLNHAEYSHLLASIAKDFKSIFLVVDALDECDEDSETRLGLLKEIQALEPTIRALFTSRPHGEIEQAFLGAPQVGIYARNADIEGYVQSRLEKNDQLCSLIKSDAGLHLLLKDGVVEKCQGMFLLAKLHMDTLSKKAKYSKAAVRAAINQLPRELDLTYDDAIERINSQDEADACLGKQVLSWVYFTYVPLTIRLLQQALACQRGDVASDEESLVNPELLISVCAGLTTVEPASQTVHLIHYTTQEYLQRHPQHFMPYASTAISATCLTQLLSSDIPSYYLCEKSPLKLQDFHCEDYKGYGDDCEGYYARMREDFMSANPFTIYAICHLTQHLQATPDPKLLEPVRKLWLSRKRLLLQKAYVSLKGPSQRKFKITEPYPQLNELQFAVFFGFESEVARILRSGFQPVDGQGIEEPTKSSCLCMAASVGYDNLVPMLLEESAKSAIAAETHQAEAWDALNCAIEGSHDSTVDLLISICPDLVSRRSDIKLRTALHLGARGSLNVMQTLIEHGADVNARDMWGQAPLHWAVTLERPRGIANLECLLRNGAAVNACDDDGWTPLTLASMSKNYEMMSILLSRGADVDGKGRIEQPLAASENSNSESPSPLSFAVQNGSVDTIRMLLGRGAIVTNTVGELDYQFSRPHENASDIERLLSENNPKAIFFGGGRRQATQS